MAYNDEVVPSPVMTIIREGKTSGRRGLNKKLAADVVDLIAAQDMLAHKVAGPYAIPLVDARWMMRMARDVTMCDRLAEAIRDAPSGHFLEVMTSIKAAFGVVEK